MSLSPNGSQVPWRTIGYYARSAFAVLLSLGVLLGGGWFVYSKVHGAYIEWRTEDDYIGEGGEKVSVIIPAGANTTQIGDILTEHGVIKSTRTFRNVAQRSGKADQLRFGRFTLRTELPAETAFAMLLDPNNEDPVTVTFPEGTTLAEQAKIIAASEDIGIDLATVQEAYADPSKYDLPKWAPGLEGFLFPTTIYLALPPRVEAILGSQVKQFNKVAENTGLVKRAKEMGLKPLEVLTTASIIEGEVHDPDYQPLVAAVIYNRLEKDMKLEMDSTVHFAVGKTGRVSTTAEDRKVDSPYNTYRYTGLPPGPINNPGKTAIEAALSPADSDALYFVTVNLDSGETRFAATYEEHEKNVALLRAWCRETGSDLC